VFLGDFRKINEKTAYLVVVRKRYDRCADSKDHAGVNLTVSVGLALASLVSLVKVSDVHSDHSSFFFFDI
jgi:hypothetical protein